MIKKGLNARLPEIGKIKIGGKGQEKKTSGGKVMRLPERYDHFVITTTDRIDGKKDENFVVNTDLMKILSKDGKPVEIPIRLLFDDIDMNFYTSFQAYKGSKLFCHGDGEFATQTDKQEPIVCNPDNCEAHKTGACKVSGILTCQIVADKGCIGGVYRFRTHGWNSVSNIFAALQYFSDNTNGILAGLPLKLKLVKKQTQDHGTIHMATIVLDGNELQEQAIETYRKRKELGIEMKKLEQQSIESGWYEDVKTSDSDDDIQLEYFPENLEPADTQEERITNIIPVEEVKTIEKSNTTNSPNLFK